MSRRRYKIGLNPAYDKRFDHRKEHNALLNPTGQRMNWTALEATSGGAPRMLKESQEHHEATLRRLANHEEQFEKLKLQAAGQGRPEPTPSPEFIQERLELEAEADIIGEEVDLLLKMVRDASARKEAARVRDILPFGPRGDRKGGIIKSQSRSVPDTIIPVTVIDGQKVSYRDGNEFKKPFIDDPASPYNGLDLKHYWPMAEAWIKEHRECKRISPADLPPRPGV